MSFLHKIKKVLPVSSRSFHAFEQYSLQRIDQLHDEIHLLREQNEQLREELIKWDQHDQQKQMLLYWQLYRNSGEDLTDAKQRFFRSLPKADGLQRTFQRAEIKLFREFDKLCKEHSIKYWAASGTLLGALIYNDMIPWDDDIDVFIARDDLERLKVILSGNKQYRITEVWDWIVACKQIRFRLVDEDNPIFVDLFPLDYITTDPAKAWEINRNFRQQFVSEIREKFCNTQWSEDKYLYEHNELFAQIDEVLSKQMHKMREFISLADSQSDATGLIRGIENIDEEKPTGPYPIQDWTPEIYLKYDNFLVPTLPAYHAYLTRAYGDYYKIPSDIDSHEHVDYNYISAPCSVMAMEKFLQEK